MNIIMMIWSLKTKGFKTEKPLHDAVGIYEITTENQGAGVKYSTYGLRDVC